MEHDPLLDPLKSTAEERYFELTKRRKAFADRSGEWIEAPRMIKDNVPLPSARKDTAPCNTHRHRPEPAESSEDEAEF